MRIFLKRPPFVYKLQLPLQFIFYTKGVFLSASSLKALRNPTPSAGFSKDKSPYRVIGAFKFFAQKLFKQDFA
jgi:hypothetical protein